MQGGGWPFSRPLVQDAHTSTTVQFAERSRHRSRGVIKYTVYLKPGLLYNVCVREEKIFYPAGGGVGGSHGNISRNISMFSCRSLWLAASSSDISS